jgi:hypothetical protein
MRDRAFALVERELVLETPPKNRHREDQQTQREQNGAAAVSRRIAQFEFPSPDVSLTVLQSLSCFRREMSCIDYPQSLFAEEVMNKLLGQDLRAHLGAFVWGVGVQQIPRRPPDLLSSLMALASLMRLSLMKAAPGRWLGPRSRRSGVCSHGRPGQAG